MKNKIVNRDIGIEFLRGASIVYLVGFWHMLNYTDAIPNYNNVVTYRITWIILGTFVFISGFFIGKKRIELKKESLITFYINRVLRIYPLYLISLVTFIFFGLSDFTTSLKAALMLSMFLKPSPPTLWFVTMLMIFYIMSPFLMLACQKIKIIKMVVIYLILSIVLMCYFYFTRLLDVRIVMYLPAFVFGLFVANNEISVSKNEAYLFFALLIGVLISFLTDTPYKAINWLFATLMVTIAPYFLFKLFSRHSIWFKKIKRIILALSYSSYCMYLFHRPIYIVYKKLYFPDTSALQLIYLVIFCLPSIVLFSYSLQKIYDIANKMLTNKLIESKKSTLMT